MYDNHSCSIPFMCDSNSLLYAKALCHIYTESIYSIPKYGIIMLSCKTYVQAYCMDLLYIFHFFVLNAINAKRISSVTDRSHYTC